MSQRKIPHTNLHTWLPGIPYEENYFLCDWPWLCRPSLRQQLILFDATDRSIEKSTYWFPGLWSVLFMEENTRKSCWKLHSVICLAGNNSPRLDFIRAQLDRLGTELRLSWYLFPKRWRTIPSSLWGQWWKSQGWTLRSDSIKSLQEFSHSQTTIICLTIVSFNFP